MIPASQIPANLPQHIREHDAATWKRWMDSRQVSSVDGKRVYTRHLTGFYTAYNLPIRETDMATIENYEQHLRGQRMAEATIKHTIRTIKNYWTYARAQEASRA